MTYEVRMIRCGHTETIIIEGVKGPDEAKKKALVLSDEGYTVSTLKLIDPHD